MQKSIFPQKIQKSLCITTKSLYTNSNFKRNYLENYNDSEHAVKTKNAPFFMIFPNIFSYGCKLLDWSFNELSRLATFYKIFGQRPLPKLLSSYGNGGESCISAFDFLFQNKQRQSY